MPHIPADTKAGFWLGLGLLAAFTIFGIAQMLLARTAHAAEGKAGG